ncbi:hypothetical protein [Pseudooceanicola nanhaiensis]|uniref:hypothetical protein n=1 Tax=Pseudooceanicola nanhaiensis TaxID=375761 RepID=UPI0035130C6E
MSSVALLCGIIAQSGKVAANAHRDSDGYGSLVTAGLVQAQGLVQSVLCDACDIGHDAAITFEDGRYGHTCPEAGFVPVERADLIAVAPDFDVLTRQIASALDCGQRKPRSIGEQTWHIGTLRSDTADIAVYFQARLQSSQDLQALETTLRGQVRTSYGLVLTAHSALAVPGLTTAPLDQLFRFDAAKGSLVAEADPATLVGAPVTRKGGRPAIHGDRIKAIIADRAVTGCTEQSKNAEIRAIQADYAMQFPNAPTPSRSAIMYHLPK